MKALHPFWKVGLIYFEYRYVQVEVAATHIEVIMYSFDAWSYGSLEVDKVRRMKALHGQTLKFWTKNVDVSTHHLKSLVPWSL